ncbi:lanthionine synthetase [Saccharothrix sp. NRRL B-16348]|uniref:lanthionine synthetase C family protein n=1 Tax=Saccharothrix sp. NRRL B-16348 TaxID=1415542 RepID=UPI0006AFA5A4|nr:lanthionine synthetase C family protein [Saccharothrix sp. NRRL B-16348]KOX27046.1 lanthionine synthetase [Saccharothrix sp. NRRL B-16348]
MTMSTDLAAAAEHHAQLLHTPPPRTPGQDWAAQNLATGSAGIALAHIERARSGLDNWRTAHTHIRDAADTHLSDHDSAALFLGAPALVFVLDAAAGTSDRYRTGLADLDAPIARLAHRRTRTALARIDTARPATFAEYDIFSGLSGLGALLLRRDPGGSALEQILHYLVALTRPLTVGDEVLPGWWVGHDPHRKTPPGHRGHANLGASHGIAGPLALLAQAARRGITVDGQHQAITDISRWLDHWQRLDGDAPWWPEHVDITELRTGRTQQTGPTRPSWCYGTPGIARAGQLAAIALGDNALQDRYERALLACLSDDTQLARLTDAGLCHGVAGTFQTLWRAAADAATPALSEQVPRLADALLAASARPNEHGPGLLNGTAGIALALHTAATDTAPTSGWDACLLID